MRYFHILIMSSADRKNKQLISLKSTLENTYSVNPKIILGEEELRIKLNDSLVNLKQLPPQIQEFYGELVSHVLMEYEELKDEVRRYNVVWFWVKLKGVHIGGKYKHILAGDWESEHDFYECSERLYQHLSEEC